MSDTWLFIERSYMRMSHEVHQFPASRAAVVCYEVVVAPALLSYWIGQ